MKKIIFILLTVFTFSQVASAKPLPWVCHAEISQEVNVDIEIGDLITQIVVPVPKRDQDYSIQSIDKAISDAFTAITPNGLNTLCQGQMFLIESNLDSWPYFASWSYTSPETNLETTCTYICKDLKWEDSVNFSKPAGEKVTKAAKPLMDYVIKQAEQLASDFLYRLF